MLKKILLNVVLILISLGILYGMIKFITFWIKCIISLIFVVHCIGILYIYG